uniref:Uncharacterized protein n=2 Tax=Lygus hesperus TaxID=30085 RepID=A0A146KT63_LYGHE
MLVLTLLLPFLGIVTAFELESDAGEFNAEQQQIARFRRSPEPRGGMPGDRGRPEFKIPPWATPNKPNPFDKPKQRFPRAPEPEPFVDRYSSGGRRGGSGYALPPGVNPTFPKNGGQWPDAYKVDKYESS